MTDRAFSIDDTFQDLGDGQWLDGIVGLGQDRSVRAIRRAQRFLCLRRTDRHHDHFIGLSGFLQAELSTEISSNGFIDISTFARSMPKTIRLEGNLHIGINHPFDGDRNLHLSGFRMGRMHRASLSA